MNRNYQILHRTNTAHKHAPTAAGESSSGLEMSSLTWHPSTNQVMVMDT